MRGYIKIILCIYIFFMSAGVANAAGMNLFSSLETLQIGEEFIVSLIIDTEDTSINAAQAQITYPNELLELVSISKNGSALTFWVEEPVVSNETGIVSFVAGSPNGLEGESLLVLQLNFKAIGNGVAKIDLLNAVIAANDGKGSNVLSSVGGVSILVNQENFTPEIEEPITEPEPEIIPELLEEVVVEPLPEPLIIPEIELNSEPEVLPELEIEPEPEPIILPIKVTRDVVKSEDLPIKPVLQVPLYPDSEQWYSHLGDVIVLWDVPADITQVATKVSKNPNGDIDIIEEELLTGKNHGVLEEGIWYVHVKFKNNIGWGEVSSYKISLDTTPPVSFSLELDNDVSDNPKPRINFYTQDSLSGINQAIISIDNQQPFIYSLSSESDLALNLPKQASGQHNVVVKIVDAAGNSVEDEASFEILALPTPQVTFFTNKVSEGEEVFVSGRAIPHGTVIIHLNDTEGRNFFSTEVESDASGNWSLSIKDQLVKGNYSLIAKVQDYREASSNFSEPYNLKIKAKVVLSLGGIDLSLFGIITFILLFIIILSGFVLFFIVTNRNKKAAYKIIVSKDINKFSSLLDAELQALNSSFKSLNIKDNSRAKEIESHIAKIKDITARMKKYIGAGIKKIK